MEKVKSIEWQTQDGHWKKAIKGNGVSVEKGKEILNKVKHSEIIGYQMYDNNDTCVATGCADNL